MAAPAALQYAHMESAEISRLERERLPLVAAQMPLAAYLPIGTAETDLVMWEVQDDVTGMTYAVGQGEAYPEADNYGVTRFGVQPAEFGESRSIDPNRITGGREIGTFGDPLDANAEIARMQQEMASREQTLIEFCRAQLLTKGRALALKRDGSLIEVARYNPQTAQAAVSWDDHANAKPLTDLGNVAIGFAGNGHDFGYNAHALANKRTWTHYRQNRNLDDLGGMRGQYGATFNTISAIADLHKQLNIPQLVENDATYKDEATKLVTRYIPDGIVTVVGWRVDVGVVCGDYLMVKHPSNPGGAAGLYTNTWTPLQHPKVPHTERGHRGGIRVRYRRQVVNLKVIF